MQHTEGIILKKTISGEADVFVTVFTREFGKLRILAKGAKKINAKLAPHLDTLNRSEIAFVKGKELMRLTGAITADYHKKIKADYNRLLAGFFAVELADQLMEEEAVSKKEYEELAVFLRKLDSIADKKVPHLPYLFAVRFLSLLGYHPCFNSNSNEIKLIKACLCYGYDILDKLDLSGADLKKLHIVVEKMLFEVVHREIKTWKKI